MMIVRVIFVETTLPVRIRPRIEILPVKGHFLSVCAMCSCTWKTKGEHTDVGAVDCV